MPLSAIFILFDIVVHQPQHRDTDRNLLLLDKAGDYFGLIDMASDGLLPGRNLAKFSSIARQYVDRLRSHDLAQVEDNELLFGGFSLPCILQGSVDFQQWASGAQDNDFSVRRSFVNGLQS